MATLLVANAGGHLQELFELFPRLHPIDHLDPTWVTFDTSQAQSLLAGENVVYVPYPHPRDLLVTARHLACARQILRERRRYSHVISTGSSIAVPFLGLARLQGLSCHYIESATRRTRPSLTGQILARLPGIETYGQVSGWEDPPWHYRGTVFDGYEAKQLAPKPVRRVTVALGSSRAYGFRRLVDAVLASLPPGVDVTWQTGSTFIGDLPIPARAEIPSQDLAAEFTASDVVITHAGVGLALLALSVGRCPVLIPRRMDKGEHIDDHQREFADELDRRGLAVACEADNLSYTTLERAAARQVSRLESPPMFRLQTTTSGSLALP
ncbi:MAG: glycosyltransferase [Acidimicrobiales bacterium]